MKDSETIRLNDTINSNIKHFLFKNIRSSSKVSFFIQMLLSQTRAARRRRMWKEQGVAVPTFMAVSITNRCNLKCTGCYAHAQQRELDKEMSTEQIIQLLSEAQEIGISFVLILGGEPFLRQEILDITGNFPKILFPIITNGT
ncbi:MAG: radical SAM protein, partial [Candidatus Hodarchaeales archaeon]